jgi:hypothetical protein
MAHGKGKMTKSDGSFYEDNFVKGVAVSIAKKGVEQLKQLLG